MREAPPSLWKGKAMKNAAAQDAQNEGHPLDPNIFATKLDLANLRNDLDSKIAEVRIQLAGLVSKVEGVETRMSGLQNYMKALFAFQTATLIAVVSIILKGVF